ncbi:alpha-amylase family glycosyl hydrolase [Butyrivibrio proteoclasticus]|uniref:alpha-amylase family glycosyl hydrolase n=1 Tax=Butyrivibrio proteoclasticus TaxID=43305 RepID=UPI000479E5F3|nr:alpha-amylase family glycosyl hydrolase [Butyrivibrio proteoclasticus]
MKKRWISLGLAMALSVSLLAGCNKQATNGTQNQSAQNTSSQAQSTENAGVENQPDQSIATDTSDMFGNYSLNILDDKYRTTYEIFVYSFYDSNGDGIGDLNGVRQKLDYINDGDDTTRTDLGCNQIWLMPISPSPTYHKYDVMNYTDIDPQYGTMEDFDALVQDCHDRGVNIIIDLVLNHTSSQHDWFKAACEYLKTVDSPDKLDSEQCPYIDYYNFVTEKADGYEKVPGTDNWYYEARFWSEMPDLNLDSDKVREEIANITGFWIEHGVDGFRLDATTYYYTGDDTKNIEFMTWLNDTVKSQKEDAYIVGEAWSNQATYSKYYASGIDSFFAFDYAGSEGTIAGIARGTSSAAGYADRLSQTEQLFSSINPDYVDAPFYTNHDMARAAGYYTGKGSQDKLKLSAALNLLMGGNAFIYYGEELGMKGSGKDENKRAPMYWADGDYEGKCDGPKDMDDVQMTYPSLEEQAADPYSIYNYYKAAILLRNAYPVIARGTTTPVETLSDKNLACFVRALPEEKKSLYDMSTFGPESLLILVNTSAEPVTVDLSKDTTASAYTELAYELLTAEGEVTIDASSVTVPAYGIVVLK